MADQVQFVLDKLVPTFRLAEDLGVFSTDEVKAIIKKTRDFEYVLKRRELYPDDFMAYVNYEVNLEKLQTLRCNAKSARGTKEQMNSFRHLQALTIKHICYIFDRAVRRFPGEQSLWDDYIGFLQRVKSYSILNTIFGRSLALNPKWDHLWIQAAVHEMNHNSNAHASRVLYQTGIRKNGSSEALWLRYFEFEIWQVCRVNERRKLLNLEESVSVTAALTDKSGGIPVVIFRHAMGSLNNNLDCAVRMHKIVASISAEVTALFEVELKKLFGDQVEMWKYLCENAMVRYHIRSSDGCSGNGGGGKGKGKGKGRRASIVDQMDSMALGVDQCLALLLEAKAVLDSSSSSSSSSSSNRVFVPLATAVSKELLAHVAHVCRNELDFGSLVTSDDDAAVSIKNSKRMRVDAVTSGQGAGASSAATLMSYFSTSVAVFLNSLGKLQDALGGQLVEYTAENTSAAALFAQCFASASATATAQTKTKNAVPSAEVVGVVSSAVLASHYLSDIYALFHSFESQGKSKNKGKGKDKGTLASSTTLLDFVLQAESVSSSDLAGVQSCLRGLSDLLLTEFSPAALRPILSNNHASQHVSAFIDCWCMLATEVLSAAVRSDTGASDADMMIASLTTLLQSNKVSGGKVTTAHRLMCCLCFNNSPAGISFLLRYYQIALRQSQSALSSTDAGKSVHMVVISSIQELIKCPFIHQLPTSGVAGELKPPEQAPLASRVEWSCLLLRYCVLSAPADPGQMLLTMNKWVAKCRQQFPQYWMGSTTLDMGPYYRQLCGMLETQAVFASGVKSHKDVQRAAALQLKPVVQDALSCCADKAEWKIKLADLERAIGIGIGNHQ